MTSPLIQVPFLRPDPIHEGPGLAPGTRPEDQLAELSKLLMAHQQQQAQQEAIRQQLLQRRGELALEQSKFDFAQSQAKTAQKQRQDAIDNLDLLLSGGQVQPKQKEQGQGQGQAAQQGQSEAQAPQPNMGAIAAGGAGFPELLTHVLAQQHQSATDQALGTTMNEYVGGDIKDPNRQAHTFGNLLAISPDAAAKFSEFTRSLGGDYEMHLGPNAGYILDKKRGTYRMIPGTGGGGSVSPEKLKVAGINMLQGLLGMENDLQRKPDADIDPVFASALREGKVLGLQAQPLVNVFQDPDKLIFRRHLLQAVDGYMGAFGTSAARSPTIFKALIGAMAPQGGESDPRIRSSAAAFRNNLKSLAQQLGSGKPVDMTQMPFFGDFMAEQQQQTPTGGATPSTLDYGSYLRP